MCIRDRVAKLLGTHVSIQVHKKVKFSTRDNSSLAVKGLNTITFENIIGLSTQLQTYSNRNTFYGLDHEYLCFATFSTDHSLTIVTVKLLVINICWGGSKLNICHPLKNMFVTFVKKTNKKRNSPKKYFYVGQEFSSR